MRNLKVWLLGAVLVALTACTVLVSRPSSSQAEPVKVVVKDHWRHHDGHWSYWYEPDNRWYYTDGTNWYYNDNDAWHTYHFDKKFGREGFERGDYRIPGDDVKIVVPRHHIYRPR